MEFKNQTLLKRPADCWEYLKEKGQWEVFSELDDYYELSVDNYAIFKRDHMDILEKIYDENQREAYYNREPYPSWEDCIDDDEWVEWVFTHGYTVEAIVDHYLEQYFEDREEEEE